MISETMDIEKKMLDGGLLRLLTPMESLQDGSYIAFTVWLIWELVR